MSGPWEKYQTAETNKPWEKYASKPPEPPPNEDSDLVDTIRAGVQGFGRAPTLGYGPHISAMAQPFVDRILNATGVTDVDPASFWQALPGTKEYIKARDENLAEEARLAREHRNTYLGSALAGGVVTGLASGKFFPMEGLGSMGRIAQAAKGGATIAGLSNPGDAEGEFSPLQLAERLWNAGEGATKGAAMAAAFEAPNMGPLLKTAPKANAGEIEQAAENLNIKPTPGMVTDSPFIQGMESSLEQSPSLAGAAMRKSVDQVRGGLQKAAEGHLEDATSLTPFESGELAKTQMIGEIGERSAAPQMAFQEAAEHTQHIAPGDKSLNAVARNIENIREAQLFPDSSGASLANQIAKAVRNAKSADDIKLIRTMIGQELRSAEGSDKFILGQALEKVKNLEENTIMRGAIKAARTPGEGQSIGKDVIGQLRNAREQWRGLMQDIGEFSENAKLGKMNTPGQFTDAIEGLQSEKLADRLFNTGDFRLMQSVKDKFPETFETLKQAKLAQIAKQAAGPDGKIAVQKLLSSTKSMGPEARNLLFGAPDALNDMQTVVQSLPPKIGPSGTPQGEMFKQSLNPFFQLNEAGRYGLYKAATTPAAQKLADTLTKLGSSRMVQFAQQNPHAFQMMVNHLSKTPEFARRMGDGPQYDPGAAGHVPEGEAQKQFLQGN